MSEHCCFCPGLDSGDARLPLEEARHIAKVLRLRSGDQVTAFDGQGRWAPAVVRAAERNAVRLELLAPPVAEPPPAPRLVLRVAMPKGPRQQVLVEKCTELGVSGIEPIICERSVVRPGKEAVEKWRRSAIEAAKQSHQWWLPRISAPTPFTTSMTEAPPSVLRFLASPEAGASSLHAALSNQKSPLTEVQIWIGPEGGFTDGEIARALAVGIPRVTLGRSILRIETAAIAAAALLRLTLCE